MFYVRKIYGTVGLLALLLAVAGVGHMSGVANGAGVVACGVLMTICVVSVILLLAGLFGKAPHVLRWTWGLVLPVTSLLFGFVTGVPLLPEVILGLHLGWFALLVVSAPDPKTGMSRS